LVGVTTKLADLYSENYCWDRGSESTRQDHELEIRRRDILTIGDRMLRAAIIC
jgi:hypothetical protein